MPFLTMTRGLVLAALAFASLSHAQDRNRDPARGQRATERETPVVVQRTAPPMQSHRAEELGRVYATPAHPRGDPRYDRTDARRYYRDDARRFDRTYGHRLDRRYDYRHDQRYYSARGAQLRRGGVIAHTFRGRGYVVDNWRAHGLHRPYRGQQWVQVGPDYALIAIATGVILQLALGH